MSDNPFELPEEGNENEGNEVSENATIQELRKYAQRQERAVKAAEKELSDLRTFKADVIAERRDAAITSAFTEVGLSPAHAKLYKATNPEVEIEAVTAEAVAGLANEYGLAVQATGQVPAAPEPAPTGYHPVTTGSAAPLAMLSQDEVDQLMRDGDFATVNKAYAEGRVKKEEVPWRRV